MPVFVTGKSSAIRLIEGISRRAKNPEGAWPQVGNHLSGAVAEQFASSGARFGTPWKPLTPRYLQRKLRSGFPPDILIATGEMMGTFVSRPMNIEIYAGDHAIFGSSNQKAEWHHNGTHRNGKRVNPPRPILKATKKDARAIAKILANHVMGR